MIVTAVGELVEKSAKIILTACCTAVFTFAPLNDIVEVAIGIKRCCRVAGFRAIPGGAADGVAIEIEDENLAGTGLTVQGKVIGRGLQYWCDAITGVASGIVVFW